jgi:hypothetical protein
MHAQQADATGAVQMPLRYLADALVARGLTVRLCDRDGLLTVRNEAAATDDPIGRTLSPGLSQVVALRPTGDGTWGWFWRWPGARPDAPPEYEPLCPADDVEQAAARIACVLRLDQKAQR